MQTFSKSHQQLLQVNSNPLNTDNQVDSGLDSQHHMDNYTNGVDDEEIDLGMMDEDNEEEKEEIGMQYVAKLLGCDCSDLRLIVNVASVYSPPVLHSVL